MCVLVCAHLEGAIACCRDLREGCAIIMLLYFNFVKEGIRDNRQQNDLSELSACLYIELCRVTQHFLNKFAAAISYIKNIVMQLHRKNVMKTKCDV